MKTECECRDIMAHDATWHSVKCISARVAALESRFQERDGSAPGDGLMLMMSQSDWNVVARRVEDAESLLALALTTGLAEADRLRLQIRMMQDPGLQAARSAPPVVEVVQGPMGFRLMFDGEQLLYDGVPGYLTAAKKVLVEWFAKNWPPQVAAGGSWEALIPDEADHALSYLLALIGSLGNASWTSHLRHEFGDEMADKAVAWIGKHTSVSAFSTAKVSTPWSSIRSNMDFHTSDCMAHYCGKDRAIAIGVVIGKVYDFAKLLMPTTWSKECWGEPATSATQPPKGGV